MSWVGRRVNFSKCKTALLDLICPAKVPFFEKSALWPIGHSQLYSESKTSYVTHKLNWVHVFRGRWSCFQSVKRHFFDEVCPKKTKCHFDLWDHQVNILSFIMSQKFAMWHKNLTPNKSWESRRWHFLSDKPHFFDKKKI